MMKSLYSGVSGLKVHNQRMDVIGNNIANVNTNGYKTSTVTFRDVFYQTKGYASEGDYSAGGVNPKQIGYGAKLGSINQVMTQSGFTYTDNVYDCAIDGDAFFQVMDEAGNVYYTRNGEFRVDDYGNLTDSNGYIVLGVSGDPTGVEPASQRVNLYVPTVMNQRASVYKEIDGYGIEISVPGYGPDGNISVTFEQSDVPFATLTGGKNLVVQMDLTRAYANGVDFEAAVNEAIRVGGVNLPEAAYPLNIDFTATPPNTASVKAENTIPLGDTYLNFRAETAGEFANSIEIVLQASETATVPTARWSDNILYVDLPGGYDKNEYLADGTTLNPNYHMPLHGFTIEQIQAAINKAAGMREDPANPGTWIEGNPERYISISNTTRNAAGEWIRDGYLADFTDINSGLVGSDGTTVSTNNTGVAAIVGGTPDFTQPAGLNPPTIAIPAQPGPDGALGTADDIPADPAAPNPNYFNLYELFKDGTLTPSVGLAGGEDNFYSQMAESLATVQLEGGYLEEAQTVSDLSQVYIDEDGSIFGEHAVHGMLYLGRIDIATFVNPEGLQQVGNSYWQPTLASGEPEVKLANVDGSARVISSATEMSNVDLSQEFSDMIITQRGFQANSRVITVSDTMLEELINLKR